ncbi:protein DEHYDRATION-INDUCED 19 2-like protein [Carex littledalei]|uniref:Protein DEHYDRATION-INDUCED 19 2-like protein n=1 Tax=Carex littledalei TaxID=544730 RepID=A0A833VJT0_9POAL|nr:protein DEHYDRATION-INDUCED 19 2-like protein [Carex littledalei]
MESDSWSRLSSSASRRLQSRYDLYLGFEELDGGDDDTSRVGMEYNCPFCGEDFDFVGFCCHVDDEHVVETKNGVCPICTAKVGMDLVGHLTMQHAIYLQHKRRYRKNTSSSSSLLSLLRKDLRDGTLQSLLAGTSLVQPASTAAAPDPFLSSFISNFPLTDSTKAEKTESNTTQSGFFTKTADEKTPERAETASLSEKDQRERTRRSEFVQGIVLSTLFDDIL